MKAVIIANPTAGGGRAYARIRRYTQQWKHPDWAVEILTTKEQDQAGRIALELLENPPDLLAVCGLVFKQKEGAYADNDPNLWKEIKEKGDAMIMAIGH